MTRSQPRPLSRLRKGLAAGAWRDLACLAAIAAAIGVLLHESLLLGRGLVPADGIFRFAPWLATVGRPPTNPLLIDQYAVFAPQREFVHRRLLQGDFPLWNPHIACGVPNLASMQGGLLSPVVLPFLFLDPFRAAGFAAFVKLFLAGAFTYFYVRSLAASRAASLLAGLVFSLCGFMIVWLGHPHVSSAIWLPLLFVSAETALRGPLPGSGRHAIGLGWVGIAVGFACVLLGGHLPTAVHVLLALVAYFAVRLRALHASAPSARLVAFAASLGLAAMLAAPQLLPYVEYLRESSTELASAALARATTHLPAGTWLHFLLPYAGGSPVTGFEDLAAALGLGDLPNFNERTGYVGIVPLFLAGYAAVRVRSSPVRFFTALIAVCLIVVYGISPLPDLLRFVPILAAVNHTRLLLLIGFAVAVLAAMGLDALAGERSGRLAATLAIGFAVAVGGAVALRAWRSAPALAALGGPARAFVVRQAGVFLGGVLVVLVIALARARLGRRGIALAAIAWATLDLLLFGTGYNPAIERALYYPSSGVIDFLRADTSPHRILGASATLLPNTAEVYGFDDVRGWDFTTVRRYEELITGSAGDFFFYSAASETPPTLDLLNARYIVAGERLPLPSDRFEEVYADGAVVYRDRAAVDRALVVPEARVLPAAQILTELRGEAFDPRKVVLLERDPEAAPSAGRAATDGLPAEARLDRRDPDEVVIEVSSPAPAFLLLLDTWFPGWEATVNGRAARVERTDYAFRAVRIPAGRSTVRFSYRPASWRIGLAFAGLAVAILLAGALAPGRVATRR